jgi:hypothetical protein
LKRKAVFSRFLTRTRERMRKNKALSENDLIKKDCKIEYKWDPLTTKWTVKISHITDGNAYSSVHVSVEGFENFREASDRAFELFKRNIRNSITDHQTIREKYTSEDFWPEYLVETI